MDVLFVNACVRDNSRTKRLCDVFMCAHWAPVGAAVREINLSREPISPLDGRLLETRDKLIAEEDFSSEDFRLAREFAKAEEILIGAPYWDCSVPAVLKIYLERIAVNGVVFSYGIDGRPVKENACKKLTVITTAGGFLPQDASIKKYWQELCELFCIPDFQFFAAEGLDIVGNDAERLLEEAARRFD